MNNDPYELVLKDLIKQRDELNLVIDTLRAKSKQPTTQHTNRNTYNTRAVDGFQGSVGVYSSSDEYYTRFKGMMVLEAIKKLLQSEPLPMKASLIAAKLIEGGLEFESSTPKNTVSAMLSRAINAHDRGIVKTGRGDYTSRK